jgi:hypothetical protein
VGASNSKDQSLNHDRRHLLDLAEHLHPGSSQVTVFNRWLERSPLKPTRFLPLVDAARQIPAA